MEDAAVEMKTARFCFGASKVQHLLRVYGEALTPVLEAGGETVDLAFQRFVTGLTPEGRAQAALGEKFGGLNARRMTDQVIACEFAAKLVARAKIKDVDEGFAHVGLMYGGDLLGWIDE
eukprot:6332872-Lingulodinium_polyedra.AAC.1